jgi:hypothetical protein
MPVLDGLIVLGIVILAMRVIPMMIKGRQEHRRQRAELAAKQRSEETLERAIALALADEQFAPKVKKRSNN